MKLKFALFSLALLTTLTTFANGFDQSDSHGKKAHVILLETPDVTTIQILGRSGSDLKKLILRNYDTDTLESDYFTVDCSTALMCEINIDHDSNGWSQTLVDKRNVIVYADVNPDNQLHISIKSEDITKSLGTKSTFRKFLKDGHVLQLAYDHNGVIEKYNSFDEEAYMQEVDEARRAEMNEQKKNIFERFFGQFK